jgi:class 3 adenylate cyclase
MNEPFKITPISNNGLSLSDSGSWNATPDTIIIGGQPINISRQPITPSSWMTIGGQLINTYRHPWQSTPEEALLAKKVAEKDDEISKLKKSLDQKGRDLAHKSEELKMSNASVHALNLERNAFLADYDDLKKKEQVRFYVSRVSEDALQSLMMGGCLESQFSNDTQHSAFVISVDIRRSTELMLKAKKPDEFAGFITKICDAFRAIIINHYGIFDKFTGDGILAFFPEFYSGKDAGLRCVRAAMDCHRAFSDIYRQHRACFNSVLMNVGLGIGIDYGQIKIVQLGQDFTIVGAPVVYACRLGCAPVGLTYANQGAYEQFSIALSAGYISSKESTVDIKHEGETLVYQIELLPLTPQLLKPEWAVTPSAPDPASP